MKKYTTNSKVGKSYPSPNKRRPKVAQQQLGIQYPVEVPRAKKLSKKAQILLYTFQNHA